MSYGFENQISAFYGNYIPFCTFSCQGTFFVTVLWKFDKIKNFWLFFSGAKDERRTTNQPEIFCPSWKNSYWSTKVASRSQWWWHDVKNLSFWVAQEVQREKSQVEVDHRSGRPSISRTDENVERVRQKVRSDSRLTVRMIADELGMNSERVWRIITEDLGMRKIEYCKNGAKVAEWRTKGVACASVSRPFWNNSKLNPTCWKESALSPRPQKARVFQVQNQGDADRFFWYPWNCPRRILATRPNY